MKKIRISTRKSPLAVWQAEYVAQALKDIQPGIEVELICRTTKGDRILDQALSKVGGKDLFVKEIENALLDGEAEVAVHSLKDVPTELPDGLHICAYPRRADPRDALVSPKGYTLETLPVGARVGTSSLRRGALLLSRRPDLKIVPIRGNVQTRLRKLEDEGMDATVLALAGLERMEMTEVVSEVLESNICLPAIGQGILAVETRIADEETNRIVSQLDDHASRVCAIAERCFLARLEGGCQVPIAGHAELKSEELYLRGLVASVDGQTVYQTDGQAGHDEAEALGVRLADELLAKGAGLILSALKE